jgi:hypothetical protein
MISISLDRRPSIAGQRAAIAWFVLIQSFMAFHGTQRCEGEHVNSAWST